MPPVPECSSDVRPAGLPSSGVKGGESCRCTGVERGASPATRCFGVANARVAVLATAPAKARVAVLDTALAKAHAATIA
eukprot:scaffold12211_cov116-Isochrysis_galbana.AAC.11